MKAHTRMTFPARTYERHGGEWREVEPPLGIGSLLRGAAALVATACAVAAIAAIGIVATAVALVLWPVALLAVGSGLFGRSSR